MTYKAPKFAVQELVPEHLYEEWGESAYRFVNPLLAISWQQIRNKFGRILINSYNRGRHQSGVRTADFYVREYGCSQAEAQRRFAESDSMHKYGCAGDGIPLDTPLEVIIDYIKNNPDEFPFISFIEVDVDWLHIDVRNQPYITFWSPEHGTVYVAKQTPFDWESVVPNLALKKKD